MSNSARDVNKKFFDEVYGKEVKNTPKMPWDICAPQPLVVNLADAGEFAGDVLDVGCGLGENSIFLASRGMRVTGLDCARSAVEEARTRADAKGVDVTFDVADATVLAGYDSRFETVLDCALYHCLTEQERHQYISALTRVTRPGAQLHILCFSPAMRGIFPERHVVSKANLRSTFRDHAWAIERLDSAVYTTAYTPPELQAVAAAMLGETQVGVSRISSLETDDKGRVLLPIYQVRAVRSA